ncbi:MAG: leucyl aminopeptidase [Acidimicrobiia bacterium]|nr:MAG: leucyl aminopeptidase [Acidimicrobiia bacterium]
MITITPGDLTDADLLVIPVLVDRVVACNAELAPDLEAIGPLLDAKDFTGKKGQTVFVQTPDGPTPEALLVGLGEEIDAEGLRRAAGTAARASGRYKTVATALHRVDLDDAANAVALGSWLGAYSFDEYKSEPKREAFDTLILIGDADLFEQIESASAVARGVLLARDLVNRPARDKPPVALAAICQDLSESIDVTVYDENDIAEAGFGGLLAVNLGADNPARMVVMRYEPEGATKTVAFVGKGIVFDSGGLSIKPAAGMETMKTDMAGAAAVMGATKAIAELGLVVNVIGITPFTENLTGGSAQRPGDVMRAYNGKTIEVLNTDAEGRLVLADGLALAVEQGPDLIVDIATLTGACKVALGPLVAGMIAADDEAADLVAAAAEAAGEKVWRLPLEEEYRALIESDVADMKNTAGRWGGAITAALILSEFVDDVPWVHLDVAGPARADKTEHYVAKGGSGFGVRTLVSVAQVLQS